MAGGGGNLKLRWLAWSGRFAVLQPREKALIVGATVVAILFGGFTFWIEPGQLQTVRLKKAIAQQQDEQAQLREQIQVLATKTGDPDAANRLQLDQLRKQLVALERDIKAFDGTLVAPSQAPALLQTLLARHRGLSLIGLTTLPPQPLIDPPAPKNTKEGEKPGAAKVEAPALPGGNIYKHGIEIKLAGGYHDLMAYVAELESSPQKLLWGAMRLSVKGYPVGELTLTVYTLSLDSTWLIV